MTNQAPPDPMPCPSCAHPAVRWVGRLQEKGGLFRLADPGSLYDCPECRLLSRRPFPGPQELARLYREVGAEAWPTDPGRRRDFRQVKDLLLRHVPSGRVLDVGCFRGDFLTSLDSRYAKFGLEYADSASVVAAARGIQVIGRSLEDAQEQRLKVDAVVLIDVLEHIAEPLRFLCTARDLLRPRGVVLISTGDAESWLWRRHRLDYWYYFSEHVSFFHARWFAWAARQLRLSLFISRRFHLLPLLPEAVGSRLYPDPVLRNRSLGPTSSSHRRARLAALSVLARAAVDRDSMDGLGQGSFRRCAAGPAPLTRRTRRKRRIASNDRAHTWDR